ncbi:metallophosphoesterase [Pelotalea chapellei]|uniref:Metallophosphoesterase family protein n=1 Tax=Pelotalea chapellei TaxID=44671 RepID=A0ABS5U4T0_9BACT|nr:metallophosphoesterase [Pelotalea chapellei]MBT1070685.1 metallophosphoesterase family protein [Pelotalea chapellei]
MRIVWLTDLHLNFVGRDKIEELVGSILSYGPDAILLTGDTSVASFLPGHLRDLADGLQLPIYFILGNHDYYGSSIRAVNVRIASLAARTPNLVWLSKAGVVHLTADTCLIGHEGLADGRLGDPWGSEVQLNDYYQIEELVQPSKVSRLAVQNHLGDTAASHLRHQLKAALAAGYRRILVALHAPPFAEACWHEGQLSSSEFLPHFACGATGEVLRAAMEQHHEVSMTVHCGHTHSSGEVKILPNLQVLTAGAEYYRPQVVHILDVL